MDSDHFIRCARGITLRNPKLDTTSYEPFVNQVDGERESRILCQRLGCEFNDKGPSIWIHVRAGVHLHRDSYGRCLVFLKKGRGTLYAIRNRRVEDIGVLAGEVVLFNDRLQHWWISSAPCTILVCNVKGITPYERNYRGTTS